jgi:hypothetical protein
MEPVRHEAAPERRLGTVERAFQIARAGGCGGMSELTQILKGERFEKVDEHLAGYSIRRELRQAWEAGNLANPDAREGIQESNR